MRWFFLRWKYRFICWFWDKPDAAARRVEVENALLEHVKNKTTLSPEECHQLALKLGTATWYDSRRRAR